MSGERARLFVGLELPAEVRDAVERWSLVTIGSVAGMRPIAPGHLHVTLCFLGWQPVDQVEAVAATCERLGPGDPPAVALGDVLWLPPRRPRVLAIGLDDEGGRTTAIQSELSELLEAGGWYESEQRPYLPHVTVARAGRRDRAKPLPLSAPEPLSFIASRVTLFRSRLSPGGARYEALSTVSLVGTA